MFSFTKHFSPMQTKKQLLSAQSCHKARISHLCLLDHFLITGECVCVCGWVGGWVGGCGYILCVCLMCVCVCVCVCVCGWVGVGGCIMCVPYMCVCVCVCVWMTGSYECMHMAGSFDKSVCVWDTREAIANKSDLTLVRSISLPDTPLCIKVCVCVCACVRVCVWKEVGQSVMMGMCVYGRCVPYIISIS